MSYFEFTKRDMREERARGAWEAKRRVADLFAALADDTARKLDDDTADRQTLLEDLLHRVAELANTVAGVSPIVTSESYPALAGNMVGTPHLPMLPPYEETNSIVTLDLTEAAREAWEKQTFNGIPRHEHAGMSDDRCYHSFDGRRCGHFWGHDVHVTEYEERRK